MKLSRTLSVWSLALSLVAVLPSVYADEDLPPPPMDELPALEGDAGMPTAEAPLAEPSENLPPPPGQEAPVESAELSPTTIDETPPPLVSEPLPPPAAAAQPSQFSSHQEIEDVNMADRVNPKELVLWLTIGPSYGTLQTMGVYHDYEKSIGQGDAKGGLGYNAGLGFMITSLLQGEFGFVGTPRTKSSTVDQAMFGIGPRLGFIYLMAMAGVQRGPDLTNSTTVGTGAVGKLFSIGAKAGLDLVLGHPKDSRVSYGLAPEAFYIQPQAKDGYRNVGASVSLRIYGYENAF